MNVKEKAAAFSHGQFIGVPPAAALRSLSSVALSSEQAMATLSGWRIIFQGNLEPVSPCELGCGAKQEKSYAKAKADKNIPLPATDPPIFPLSS